MADNVTHIGRDTDETKMPQRDALMKLFRAVGEVDEKIADFRDSKNDLVKTASEDKNIHKGAFKLVSKLLRMDDEKRDAFLSHFDHYRDVMGVDEGRTAELPFVAAAE